VKRFAARRKIAFPPLSDPDKQVISAFDLFNDRFPEGSRYYGTAVPRVVVVNADGVVTNIWGGHGYTSEAEIETILERASQPAS
jgi:peroxiredoxin